jgi:hypothetical protein
MWIREVCDKQDYSQVDPEDIGKLKESRFWREWRAPKLIHLHPAGNVSYNPALAWAREDEQRTQQLLNNRSHRSIPGYSGSPVFAWIDPAKPRPPTRLAFGELVA